MQWVDGMRGFSMIVVVLGHVLMSMGIGGYDSFISSFFLSFRMPLFFFVSGFFSYRAISWWNPSKIGDILKRKFQAQVLCTFVFLFIYQLVFFGYIKGISEGFEGYWFTIVLFQMYLCYLLFSLLSRKIKRDITVSALIILSVGGIVAVVLYHGHSRLWEMLSWINLTKYFQFFTLGVICSKYREYFFRLLGNSGFIALAVIGWIISLLLWYNDSFRLSFPYLYMFIHDIFIRYCALMTVVAFFYKNASYFDYSRHGKKLQFIGRRTLDIYMIHFFLLPDISYIGPWLSQGNMFVIQLLVSGIITAIIVGLCLVISAILRQSKYLATWLFGVKSHELQG